MPKLLSNRVVVAVVVLVAVAVLGSHAMAEEPIVLTDTEEAFSSFDRSVDDEPRFDFCDEEIQKDVELNLEPPVSPVAIAPLPPAVLTGAAMLLGGAMIRFVRKVRIS